MRVRVPATPKLPMNLHCSSLATAVVTEAHIYGNTDNLSTGRARLIRTWLIRSST